MTTGWLPGARLCARNSGISRPSIGDSRMKIVAFAMIVSLLAATGAGAIAAPPLAGGEAAQVNAVFRPWDSPTSPGCAVAVVKGGRVIYERGYGMADLDHD